MIKNKRKTVIKKGHNFSYDPATFHDEHHIDFFHTAEEPQEVIDLMEPFEIDGRKFLVFDTETHPIKLDNQEVPETLVRRWVGTGKKAVPQDLPFCMSFCDGKNAVSIYDELENGFEKFKALSVLFEDPSIELIAHNIKFDMHQLLNIKMKIVGPIHDTVVIAKLANENRYSFQLMDIVKDGIKQFEYMVDNYKKTHKVTDYSMIDRTLMSSYANADVWNCYLVFVREYEKLKEEGLIDLYINEQKLALALFSMERYGMKVDVDYEKPLKEELQRLCDEAEASVYEQAGVMFNVNSTQQLYKVLMDLGVDGTLIKRTEKGNPSLDKKALERLANLHEVSIVKQILEYRKFDKLLGTYAVGIYDQRDANNKVHGNINQTEATTGRMSITKPALQTLPKKDTRIRSAFIPSENYSLVFMDLDQIEYRLFAHYAKAETLIEAIKKGHDIHRATAAVIYGVSYEDVTDEQRTKAKTVNFSLIYGQGDEATAMSLGVGVGEARTFKQHYFAMIPEAEPFLHTVQRVTRLRGSVKNFYGRKRRLKSDEVYKAPNALIQGCAADYIKHKIVDIYKYLIGNGYKTRLLNVVHDELVFELHESEHHIIPKLRWLLSDFDSYRVPITAGVEVGNPSWGEKEPNEDTEFDSVEIPDIDLFNGSTFNCFL